MMQPMMPVSLMGSSTSATTTEMTKADTGPYKKPPMAMTMSLGSYLRKSTMGMRPTSMTR